VRPLLELLNSMSEVTDPLEFKECNRELNKEPIPKDSRTK